MIFLPLLYEQLLWILKAICFFRTRGFVVRRTELLLPGILFSEFKELLVQL